MIKAVLTRFKYDQKQTLGILEVFDKGTLIYSCRCLELPWKNNKNSISCIPEGQYRVRKRRAEESGSRNYDHFLVMDVPGRSYILWHSGNYYFNIKGCMLMGESHIDINGDNLKDVTNTRKVISELYKILPDSFDFLVTSTIEASIAA